MKLLKNFLIAPSLVLLISTNLLAKNYTLEAMPLKEVIKLITSDLNLPYVVNSKFVEGKRSKSIQNIEGGLKALNKILKDFNLKAEIKNDLIVIKKMKINNSSSDATLEDVDIVARTQDGSATSGYRVEKITNMGPLKGKAIIDTPYSMAVMSGSLLENTIAGSIDQVFRMSPTVQVDKPSNDNDYPEIIMRGFSSEKGLLDGLKMSNAGLNQEDFEQVEILTGTSGFMYGPGNVGGRVNYVYKRPTQERLTNITMGNYGGSQYFVHADLGGQIDDKGVFGYRVNIVKQDGETSVEDEKVEKFSIAGAFDWKITDDLLAQVVLSHRDYKVEGKKTIWWHNSSDTAFDAPSSSKAYGPKWLGIDSETNSIKFDLTWNINDVFSVRSAYLKKETEKPTEYYGDNTGDFFQYISIKKDAQRNNTSSNLFLDANFDGGSIGHKMTLGYSSNKENYLQGNSKEFEKSYSNLENLSSTVEPDWATINIDGISSFYTGSNKNIFISDEITFNEQWSTHLGLNYVSIRSSYGSDGNTYGDYKDSAFTPTVSILYKPIVNLTTYLTYMEALEKGSVVGDNYSNAGEVLSPKISREVEVGLKYEPSGLDLLLTASLFRIEQANNLVSEDSTGRLKLTQDGLAVHQGLELGFNGKASENLTLLGGLTLLDARIKDSSDPELEGARKAEVANTMASVYAEYTVPTFNKLVLTGGVYYTGSATWYQKDDYKTKAYTLADLGMRYSTKVSNIPTTFRLSVNNLMNKDYWINKNYLGSPRTVAFSMTAKF